MAAKGSSGSSNKPTLTMKAGDVGPLVDRKNLPELIDSWAAVSSDVNQDGNGSTT